MTSVEGAQLSQVPDAPAALIGSHVASSPLLADESRFPIRHAHLQALQGGSAEYEMIWAGKTFRGHVEPLRDVDGRIVGTIAVAFDITERKIAEQRLAYFAQYDPLTDLPNRALLEDRMMQAISMAQRHGGGVALVTVDIDRFKEVNDLYGTGNGDEVLRLIASRMRRLVDGGATVSRIGDDQFAILLVDVPTQQEAAGFVERLHASFEAPFVLGDLEIYLTISSGVCAYPDDGHDGYALIRSSEAAMLAAKATGGNTYRNFLPSMIASSSERLALKRDLRVAAAAGQFVLHYQPIFRSDDLVFAGFEALVRWQHPILGLLPPDHFIGSGRRNGRDRRVGRVRVQGRLPSARRVGCVRRARAAHLRQYFRTAVRTAGAQRIDRRHPARNGNQSAANRAGADGIVDHARHHRRHRDAARTEVARRASLGRRFRNRLHQPELPTPLPHRRAKDRQSLLTRHAPGSQDEAIVKAIVTLASNLGLTSIAEGIESRVTLEQIRNIGADEVQGFFLGEPTPVEGALRYVADIHVARARS